MNTNSLKSLMIPTAVLGVLWFLAPSLAAMAGVVLGLFAIACWREGVGVRTTMVQGSVSMDDYQRRLSVDAL